MRRHCRTEMSIARATRRLAVAAALAGIAGTPPPAHALFDDLAVSPRARGMGEATIATSNDAWAFYYNPAMLTRLGEPQAAVTTLAPNGLDFHRLTNAAVAIPLRGRAGGLAIGWRHYAVQSGDVDLATENTLSVSHGFRLFGDASTSASFGWTLNLYNAEFASTIGLAGDGSNGLDPGSAWAAGIDVGGLVTVYDRTRVGFFTRNLNNPTIGVDAEELQRQVGVGVAYEPYPGVTSAFDLRNTLGEDFRFNGGLEFEVVPQLLLRAGIETLPNKVTGGCGVRLPFVTLDYGFSTGGGVLDVSHHFGLQVRWDRRQEAKP